MSPSGLCYKCLPTAADNDDDCNNSNSNSNMAEAIVNFVCKSVSGQ